jgi:hypothetical protein
MPFPLWLVVLATEQIHEGIKLKEQNDIRRSKLADLKSRRSVLNSPPKQRGCDEFKSLGQASSELIAKLGKRAKVGAREGTQPPSKITFECTGDEPNVIYLYSKQDFRQKKPNNNSSEKHSNEAKSCQVIFLFR